MVCTVSAGTAADYYIGEQSRYYTGGTEPIGRWYAPSFSMGVIDGAEISDATFMRLHAGLDEAGGKLAQNADGTHLDRVAGYDMTFSAPKSVSVVWALEGAERRRAIEGAHDAAVRAALSVVNDNAAFARRGKGGIILEPVELSGAIFRHGESRPTDHANAMKTGRVAKIEADPQLHSHAVLFNLAQRADGSWGSVDGRHLFRWKMAAGAIYRAELAGRLQVLGYRVERTDEKGLFEIDGVPKSVRDEFSGRRLEIVAALSGRGLDSASSPALAAAITKAGRRAKSTGQTVDRHERWRERADEIGYQLDLAQPDRVTSATAGIDPTTILEALTETHSVFRRQQIAAAVAASLVGTLDRAGPVVETVAKDTKNILESDEIVPLGTDGLGQAVYSTKKMIAMENGIATHANAMASSPFIQVRVPKHFPALSEEQIEAAKFALRPSRLAVIEGAAGSGKTTTLSTIALLYKEAGCNVIGAATAWHAAKQLGAECGIESRAVDSWLASQNGEQPVLTRNTVLIVDEAGLLSTRQMHTLLSEVRATGAKVIFTGDQRQLQAIGAGSGLSIVAEKIASTRIDTNRRQIEAWARVAVGQFSRGEAAPALDAFDRQGRLHWTTGHHETIDHAVALWRGYRMEHSNQNVIVLAKSNADVRALNVAMRAELREMGRLSGNDVTVRATDRSRAKIDLPIAKGDRLEIQIRNKALGFVNGTSGTVTRIEPAIGGHARITLAMEGRSVTFSTTEIADGKGRARIGHAYATTIYNSQGATADRAIVVANPSFSANQAYVAFSRARVRTDIVIDSKPVDSELRAKARAAGQARIDIPSHDDRKAHIATRWSRRDEKETARSFLAEVSGSRDLNSRTFELER